MLTDPRFAVTEQSFALRPDVPEEAHAYNREMLTDDEGHRRLRALAQPAFTARRVAEFRPRVEAIVDDLIDEMLEHAENGSADLLAHLGPSLAIDVLCEVLGIPRSDRPQWREYGLAAATGEEGLFADAMPAILDSTRAAIELRRAEPGDDLITDLLQIQHEDGDRLSDNELLGLSWLYVIASSPTGASAANALLALFMHPDQLAAVRADMTLMPHAVDELLRWWPLNLMSIPRYAREDVEVDGVVIRAGDPVVALIASANRDPRAYADPDRLDILRPRGPKHLGFLYGPHTCTGQALGRLMTEVALTRLLSRFPDLALAVGLEEVDRVRDPGQWRLGSLPLSF
jgi:cytochrome P450